MNQAQERVSVNTSDAIFVKVGLFVVFGMLGGSLLWAFLAQIDGASVAPGVVVVESSRKVIQHLEGGIVSEIHVREGEIVSTGQPLLSLDETQMLARVALLKKQHINLSVRLARLEAVREGASSINWVEPQFELDANEILMFKSARADQQAIFERQLVELSSQINVLDKQRVQVEQRLTGLKRSILERYSTVESFEDEVVTVRQLVDQGFTTEQLLQDVSRQLSNARMNLSREESEIQSLQSQLLEIESRKVTMINGNGKKVDEELAEARAKYQDVVERLSAANEQLERSVIRAPESGIVLNLMFNTVGGVISSGQAVMEIVPTGDKLKIEARVPTNDIDRVSVGQSAQIMFPAFDMRMSPRLNGLVVRLSADRMVDQMTGRPYFMAEIELPDEERKRLKSTLLPGMTAQVLIKTGARSMVEYLAKPLAIAMDQALRED